MDKEIDPKLKNEIEKKRASHESYQLLNDEEIIKEIESEKPLIKEIKGDITVAAPNLGRDPEVFLREIFEWLKLVITDKKNLWSDFRWEISEDGNLVYLASFYVEDFSDLRTLPKKYFDKQKDKIKWPQVSDMKSGTGIHNLLKKLKGKRVFSFKKCSRENEWWLKAVEENQKQTIEPVKARKPQRKKLKRKIKKVLWFKRRMPLKKLVKKYYLPGLPKSKKFKKKLKNSKIPPFDLAGNRIFMVKEKELFGLRVGENFIIKPGTKYFFPFSGTGILTIVGFTIDNKVVLLSSNSSQYLIYSSDFIRDYLQIY